MATKKLTPVKTEDTSVDDQMLTELRTLNETMSVFSKYLERMDWKLWMIMNMIKMIGEENGYMFTTNDEDNTKTTGEFE